MRLRTSSITGVRAGFLVRWKECDPSIDSWVPRAHVTLALVAYEEFLEAHSRVKDETARIKERQRKYESFVGENGKFSAITAD